MIILCFSDVELAGAYVSRAEPCQGIQHEPHHTQTMAGEFCYASVLKYLFTLVTSLINGFSFLKERGYQKR